MLTTTLKAEEKRAKVIRASERLEYVKRMGQLSDIQRQVALELAKRGMAPILITNADRVEFARREEASEEAQLQEEYNQVVAQEGGIGGDPIGDDFDDMPGLERDYGAERVGEGHDPQEGAHFADSALDAEY
jgi:hypothetical protein